MPAGQPFFGIFPDFVQRGLTGADDTLSSTCRKSRQAAPADGELESNMFDNGTESVAYVRDVMLATLRATVSDARLNDFRSFTLEGSWARPAAVTVYADRDPRLDDDGVRIVFA